MRIAANTIQFKKSLLTVIATLLLVHTTLWAQSAEENVERPIPRWPDGRVSFTGPPGVIGNWNGPVGTALAFDDVYDAMFSMNRSLPTNLHIDDVPFQPWARALYEERRANPHRDDPHARCKPSGGPRMFHTPYGMEILDLPDAGQVIFLSIGAPHSWRVVYMDGRDHPGDLEPGWYGHSTGRWEGDTLVIDTVGFNDKFWLTRNGMPHTTQLHLVERLTRTDFYTLKYEATIDDPGAYTESWTGGWFIPWEEGNEPFDYLCQENNLDGEVMDQIGE